MDELIARITEATRLDPTTAQKAVGIILAFIQKEGPPAEVAKLFAAMPGSEEVAAQSGDGGPGGLMGGFMGMMGGGGIMALGTKLMGAGIPMNQLEPLGRELFTYGQEKAGEDTMGAIIGGIPGLSQFV